MRFVCGWHVVIVMGLGERFKSIVGIEGDTRTVIKPMVGYNSANITLGGASYPMSLYHAQYLSYVEGLSVPQVGNIGAITGIVDAFADAAMGVITDKTRSKYGKHRRYLLWGAIPFAISYVMRWASFGISDTGNTTAIFLYYLIAALLYSLSYTVMSVPHTAMLPQIAPKYFERTQFKIVEYMMNGIGQISSFVLMAAVLGGFNMPDPTPGDRSKYMITGIVLSLWFLWPPIYCFFHTSEPSSLKANMSSVSLINVFREYGQVFSNRAFIQYFFMGLCYMIARGFYNITDQYFLISVTGRYSIFNLLNIIAGVAEASGSPLNFMLTKHRGKQYCGKLLGPFMVVGLIINAFTNASTPTFVLIIAAVLYNFGFSGPGFTIENIRPDVTDVDELVTGCRREGLIATSNSFFKKSISSFMTALVTNLLGHVFGYNVNAKEPELQTAKSILGIRLCFSVFPAIFAAIMIIMIRRYRLTKEDHELIKRLIDEKHKTGSVDVHIEEMERLEKITGKKWKEMWIGMPSSASQTI